MERDNKQMLRVKVYVNKEQIEYLQIVNTGRKLQDYTEYKVKTGILEFFTVFHKQEDGWKALLTKVLKAMK